MVAAMKNAQLPQVIADIAQVAGEEAAWTLAREKGGRQVYIPGRVDAGHWLAKLVGLDAAQKICIFYRAGGSGTHILIPMASAARSREELAKAIAEGGSSNELAGRFGKHERTIRRHKARLRDDRQGKLF
jgi:DNA-binding CsgD family transcriptional regulator